MVCAGSLREDSYVGGMGKDDLPAFGASWGNTGVGEKDGSSPAHALT